MYYYNPKGGPATKQISGVLIGVRKGERDARVERQHNVYSGPEFTGAACPVSAPRRVRFCKHWSLLVRAWFDFARFSGAESGSRVDSTDSPECVVVADGAPPESGLASSLAGLHRVVSPRGGVAEELSVRELRDSRES
ncbi:hypothetical protein MTP99_010780 [Tenebrio molitor]|jgi:hypothetical protein|nr:hypothetical protein MTP99_010780 [Tenebrio molitor]